MPSLRDNPERRKCPDHFQRRITQVGGRNRYGQPNFRLAWAQTETVNRGGKWEAMGETHVGYRRELLGDGLPHWMLLQWCDAGKSVELPHLPAQSALGWYADNLDQSTGLQILGEYPYHGSYQIALNLVAKWFDDKNQLCIHAFPLSTEIVEMMVPVIRGSLLLSAEAKLKFLKEEQEKDEMEYAKTIEDAYLSVKRKDTLASTPWLEDKMRSMERHYNAALVAYMSRNRFFQGDLNGRNIR